VVLWKYRGYAKERDALSSRIRDYQVGIATRDREMEERGRVLKEIRRFASTTLGSEEEKITASLRKNLNEMIAHFGLIESSVSSTRPTGVKNPAGEARVAEFLGKDRANYANTPDFYAVAATVSAKGTLEQAMRMLSTIQVQPWVHRVDGFTLKPNGKERDRVELTVMLTTLFFTDEKLRDKLEDPGWRPVREAEFASWMPIVVKNAFREPPPPVAPTVAVAAAPPAAPPGPTPTPPAPPPPYDDWRVSGVVKGKDGPQIMLVNEKTKEWRTLDAGGVVLDVKFVGCAGETAQISIGEEKFTIRSGQRLSERARIQ
jgi:hypothetical protein